MAYCTQSDVQTEVGGSRTLVELADLEDAGAGSGPAVAAGVTSAIAEADGYINSYLRQRFSVPLAAVAPEIAGLSAKWAARVLRRRRYKSQPLVEDQEAEKIDRAWLQLVSDGEIQLSVEPTTAASDIVIDKAAARDSALDVSRERLKGFI